MDRTELVNPRRRLPVLSLPAAPDGAPQPLRVAGRAAPVVLLVHGAGCTECRAHLDELAHAAERVREWEGRLTVVSPEPPETAGEVAGEHGPLFRVLADPEERVADAVGAGAPAQLIADRYGVLHLVHPAGPEHRWLSPDEIVEWLRYLAIQCPECEGEAL